tara:strand:- start:878 stop:1078 length:201 start_codon:yes stop_codon:yes gene_type:complete
MERIKKIIFLEGCLIIMAGWILIGHLMMDLEDWNVWVGFGLIHIIFAIVAKPTIGFGDLLIRYSLE